MKRSLLFSFITLFIFIAVSVVGADVMLPLGKPGRQVNDPPAKAPESFKPGRTIDARSYRSPGPWRKVVIPARNAEALAQALAAGAVELADYESFKLLAVDQAALEKAAGVSESAVGMNAGSLIVTRGDGKQGKAGRFNSFVSNAVVRDDFNVLLLRSGAIDTTAEDSPGNFIAPGRVTGPGVKEQQKKREGKKSGQQELRLIQFVGPVKAVWLEHIRKNGLEPIAYVPSNGYLVRGSAQAGEQLVASASGDRERAGSFIQWEGPFRAEYKIHPSLSRALSDQAGAKSGEVTVAVQVARSVSNQDARPDEDVETAKRLASSLIGDAYPVLGFTNLKMRVELSKIPEIAALGNVVNIEPWSPPELFDERASMISVGELSDDGKQARGPGYMAWLQAHGLNSRFDFVIDVTDTGFDRGLIDAANVHPDFLDASGQSRAVYARDYTSELDAGDVLGHGTINASIAAGASTSADPNARDSLGFNHGLGIAPFALLGSSKIFQSTGRFDLIEPYTKLISEAYLDGARISSNSWGANSNAYTIESQEYDARVRDAVPGQPGNQEMVICFAAGNGGPGGRIGSPGTGKNVIAVAASENARKTGIDGCGVEDEDADSALDIAFFSSGGKLNDGRLKPDISAPGTHVQGAASQHPDFNGTAVCGEDVEKPYFPKGQTLYTWSSGTSHATPLVAGGAALLRQFFLNNGKEPSAALVKAMLVNSTTYMTGMEAGGDLPHPRQGWGLLNLGRALDNTGKIVVDQSHTFSDSGQEFVITGEVKDTTRPARFTLVWTDQPGLSAFAPWVNDLDLEVTINGQIYRGNNFLGSTSQPGGEPNTKDNIESVWLPPGTVGTFVIRVRAGNVAGDGVPGNADLTDQDFALVAYNAERKDVAVAGFGGAAIAGGGDTTADPGETVSMQLNINNLSPVGFNGAHGSLATATQGVAITGASADFSDIGPGGAGDSLSPFTFTIDKSVACGSEIQFVLDVASQGSVSRVPFTLIVGKAQPLELFADDVESGDAKWTHASGVKKKKNRVDTWVISAKRAHSGGKSWFTPSLNKIVDAHLDSAPITLPPDGRNLRLVFFHTFEFEPGRFDGGVIEISTGGNFEDLGPKILVGKYNESINDFTDNPLGGRQGWVDGRLGAFQQVVVDLSSFAGKTVVIRFRIGTDRDIAGLGWFIDDVEIKGDRVFCTPVALTR